MLAFFRRSKHLRATAFLAVALVLLVPALELTHQHEQGPVTECVLCHHASNNVAITGIALLFVAVFTTVRYRVAHVLTSYRVTQRLASARAPPLSPCI